LEEKSMDNPVMSDSAVLFPLTHCGIY